MLGLPLRLAPAHLLLAAVSLACGTPPADPQPPVQQRLPDPGTVTLDRPGRDEIVANALATFWTSARLSSGEPVLPASDTERTTLPIPSATADSIVVSAVPAGLGAWCELPWQPYYLAYMQARRQQAWNEKQVAFIGYLFGVAQGQLERTYAVETCGDPEREAVRVRLRDARTTLSRSPAGA